MLPAIFLIFFVIVFQVEGQSWGKTKFIYNSSSMIVFQKHYADFDSHVVDFVFIQQPRPTKRDLYYTRMNAKGEISTPIKLLEGKKVYSVDIIGSNEGKRVYIVASADKGADPEFTVLYFFESVNGGLNFTMTNPNNDNRTNIFRRNPSIKLNSKDRLFIFYVTLSTETKVNFISRPPGTTIWTAEATIEDTDIKGDALAADLNLESDTLVVSYYKRESYKLNIEVAKSANNGVSWIKGYWFDAPDPEAESRIGIASYGKSYCKVFNSVCQYEKNDPYVQIMGGDIDIKYRTKFSPLIANLEICNNGSYSYALLVFASTIIEQATTKGAFLGGPTVGLNNLKSLIHPFEGAEVNTVAFPIMSCDRYTAFGDIFVSAIGSTPDGNYGLIWNKGSLRMHGNEKFHNGGILS